MELLQAFKVTHILGAALFIGYGLFAAIWHSFVLGKQPSAIRGFVLSRLFAMDAVLSILITGLIMGGGFRMLKVMQVPNFQFHWVWLGFMATVLAFFLLAFVIAPLTFWAWMKVRRATDESSGAALVGWILPLRLLYVALPIFATVIMVIKPNV